MYGLSRRTAGCCGPCTRRGLPRRRWAAAGALVLLLLGSVVVPPTAAGDSPSLQFDGFVEPLHDLQVAATEPGRLEEVFVQMGDVVQAGQVVATLEDGLQQSAVAIARLQMSMEGQWKAALAERDLQAARTDQLRRLRNDGMARPDELVRQETDLRIAEARLLTVQEDLQLRKLELERFELQLSRRKLRAPIAGTVARVYRKGGEFVSPSDPAVIRLITTDQLVAVVNVPAEQMHQVPIGGSVRVQLATARRLVAATVFSVSPAIDGESGTVQVRILLPNPDGRLYAGDRCTVSIGAAALRSAQRPATEGSR